MAEYAGEITEGMEGIELSRLINEYWHAGAGACLFFDDAGNAARATGQSIDSVFCFLEAVNDYRGYERGRDRLGTAFVPEGNRRRVCELLDEITELCVAM